MSKTNLIVDGHVHIYDCYDLNKFFSMAIKNLEDMYVSIYPGNNRYQKVLLLAEGKQNNYFRRFKENGALEKPSDYKFEKTDEDCSLVLKKNNEALCYILAGRQIVTREKLEVLSIASTQRIEDGLPIEEVIQRLLNKKEIAVLAWGVGKWFFKRGEIVKDIIEKYHSPCLFIGDNSARPSFWPIPELYHLAEKHGVRILRGSDPLPFADEQNRVGTYGFLIEGEFEMSRPAESFRNIMISSKQDMKISGYQDNIGSFLKRRLKGARSDHYETRARQTARYDL